MNVLETLHGYLFDTSLALLFPNPYALASLLLFLWSLSFIVRPRPSAAFTVLVRLTWVAFLIPAVTGLVLALSGARVTSAVPEPGSELTRFGFPPDPSRHWEHWMYGAFGLLSLIVIELLLSGRLGRYPAALRYLPVATLFLYGVALRVTQVAIFPGASPGT